MSDIEKVKKLRNVTGAGFKDCNAAIQESEGDLDFYPVSKYVNSPNNNSKTA